MPSRDRAILNLANSFIFHVDPAKIMGGGRCICRVGTTAEIAEGLKETRVGGYLENGGWKNG